MTSVCCGSAPILESCSLTRHGCSRWKRLINCRKRRAQPELSKHRRTQSRDQAAHFQNGPLRKIARLAQFGSPLAFAFRQRLLDQLHLQADAQQALAGFVMQLAADAAALHFLDVQHVLGQAPDLLLALRKIFHQARLFRGHQAALGRGGQQFLFPRQPLVDLSKSRTA